MLYIESLVIIGCINVVAVCGLVLLVGYTGIFSMGHAGFMAIGGYAAALLYLHLHIPYVVACNCRRINCSNLQHNYWLSNVENEASWRLFCNSNAWLWRDSEIDFSQ